MKRMELKCWNVQNIYQSWLLLFEINLPVRKHIYSTFQYYILKENHISANCNLFVLKIYSDFARTHECNLELSLYEMEKDFPMKYLEYFKSSTENSSLYDDSFSIRKSVKLLPMYNILWLQASGRKDLCCTYIFSSICRVDVSKEQNLGIPWQSFFTDS